MPNHLVYSCLLVGIATVSAAAQDPRATDLVSITPAVADRFAHALETEASERKTVAGSAVAWKTGGAYSSCESAARNSSTNSIQDRLKELGLQMQKAAAASDVATTKKLAAQLQQLSTQATAAAVPLGADSIRKVCGPSPQQQNALKQQPVDRALAAGQFTDRQYALLKERVAAYYATPDHGSRPGYVFALTEAATLASLKSRLEPLVTAVM
jgi:hypothetical protein